MFAACVRPNRHILFLPFCFLKPNRPVKLLAVYIKKMLVVKSTTTTAKVHFDRKHPNRAINPVMCPANS